ncbi:MAG TPA: hypothetical protein VMG10_14740 [Gemmataceae bacterium]|nr:hypothetical protein [Gemmataceae bacterium]
MVVLRKPQAFGWFRSLFVAGVLTSLAVSSGCETAAGTGAATGGLLGFGLGELLGHRPGVALAGAALGAAAGTVAGAGVDIARDKKAQRNAQAAAAETAARAPSLDDIVSMTQNAVPPAQIIEQVRTSGVIYRLSADQIIWLNRQGVNAQVIQALQDTALRPAPARAVYTASPVVVQQPVVEYVAPAPVVGVGYGWGPRWR